MQTQEYDLQRLARCADDARATMLVIDDEPVMRRALCEVFRAGFRVYTASDAASGIEICRRHLPDLILMDVDMPGMDGPATCRHLKSDDHTRKIPVIFVSLDGSSECETQCLDSGGVDFLPKPLKADVLKARVHAQLRHARALQQVAAV